MSNFFCSFCGSQLSVPPGYASDSLTCGHCGKPSPIPVSLLLPTAQGADRFSARQTLDYGEALTFPLRRPDWTSRLWWLALVDFVPVLNLILMRGWRLDLTRRIGYGDPQPLPDKRDLGNFLGNGVILWLMTLLYSLPLVLVVFIFDRQVLETIRQVVSRLFRGNEGAPAGSFLELLLKLAAQAAIPGLCGLFAVPLYRAAMLRFAMTGKPSVFLQPIANLRLVVRHLGLFFLLYFFELLSQTLLTVIGGALTAIGIGFLIVPAVLLPMYYWTTGHLYGRAAAGLAYELTGFQAPSLPNTGAGLK